jgi:hypothetical protein
MNSALAKDNRNLEKKLQMLAQELAYDIFPLERILESLEISQDDYKTIAESETFKRMLAEKLEVWASATNTKERTKLKVASMVEMSLEDMYGFMLSEKTGDTARVELFKTLLRSAGLLGEQAQAGAGEKISISINMGASAPVTVEAVRPSIDYSEVEDA